jgi:LacI family transcriptional regulator
VAVDQFEGARLVTEHLLELGHETVHHVAGPDGREANLRVDGWRAALDDAGARVKPFSRGDWGAASGYEAGRDIAGRDDVTAVFVANDQVAVGVLRALHEHGRTVPDDVSVVGFDDTPQAGFLPPLTTVRLTTVRQDFGEMGRRSLQLLLEVIESNERLETRVTIPATLTTRASTASPRTRARSSREPARGQALERSM